MLPAGLDMAAQHLLQHSQTGQQPAEGFWTAQMSTRELDGCMVGTGKFLLANAGGSLEALLSKANCTRQR